MKFSCESNLLQKGISIVEKAIPTKSTLPILENIYIDILEKELKFRGHNLEIGIENYIEIENVDAKGKILIKARTLSNLISKLPNQKLTFILKDNKIQLKTASVDLDLYGINADEYPVFPEIEKGGQIELTVEELKDLIKMTIFAVSSDDTKQFLNGILCKKENDKVVFIATDGSRLSLNKKLIKSSNDDFSVIIPSKAVNEIYKIIQQVSSDTKIKINISANQVCFMMDKFILVTRIIQGQFPDYTQVLPKETINRFVISRRTLLDACERANIFAAEANDIVRFFFNKEGLIITAQAPSLGIFKEKIDLNKEKSEEDLKVAFNVKLLLDVLKHIESDDLILELNSKVSPCIIKAGNNNDYIYILMPIKTSDFTESFE
ncbi:MAG: DNA polymerase III subunit beta [Candidatus Margulisiibacteriota bacterium]|jgi:DNA polymerase-3 subunit beta